MELPQDLDYLYLTELNEPAPASLRIVVSEGVLGHPTPTKWDGIDLGDAKPIIVNASSRVFELQWDHYVAYAVRNESYWKAEDNEPPATGPLWRRTNSAFLEFIAKTTFADDDYPGPMEHWALTTLDHCIDVISLQPPRIARINGR